MRSSSKDPASPESDQNKPKLPSLDPDDPEIDSLTKLLDRSLKLQTRAPAASKLVQVDKKYSLFLAVTSSKFYELRAQAKRVDKRKREEGILPKSIEGRRIGFRPEELMWNGALELKGCRPSNLTNDIHSLFGRNRFDDCPDHIYDQFIPALRLATLFLTEPICFQFWVTVGLGTRKFDEEGTRRCGYDTERIEKNVPMTEANTSQLIDYINELDQATLVHFGFKPALVLRGDHVWAVAKEVCDYYIEKPRRPFTDVRRHNVRLHGDFYIAAQRSAQLKHPDPAQQLRFQFFLAVTLVHELAHVVEGAHRQLHPGLTEPFLFDHKIKEMGAAWESIMFGGRIQPINERVDGTHGLCVYDWPGDDDLDKQSDRRIYYSISMGYIESLFQMQNWERKHNLKNWKRFHIPHNGALGIYLNSFTTMPWEEEVRDIESEIANSLALPDPDEPARKRRETRTGSPVIATKGYGEEEERDHHPKETKPVPPDRPGVKSPTNTSGVLVRRNVQAIKAQQDKVDATEPERAEEETLRAEQALKKSKQEKRTHDATQKPQDPNNSQSIQQPGENTEDEKPGEDPTPGQTDQELPQPSIEANRHRLFHPRIWGLKRAANAETFRPVNWPRFRPRVGNYATIESRTLDPIIETDEE